ncbi:MAG: hypothetical protein JST84_24245 [Acidobacteria bacterium]|nr:hypothetical protein [Acidobacteriota bacterium]
MNLKPWLVSAAVPLVSTPYLWQSLWFRLAALFSMVWLFCWLSRLRQKRKVELEQMRTLVAADLHDDIGASLSQLAVLGEVLHRKLGETDPQITTTLAAMRRISGEAVDAMSDIVWTTNPQQDSLLNLVRRMRRFASEMLPAAGIEFSFQSPAAELDLRLDAELRRQVFLIFKESLNNIVRHSGCSHATIELWLNGSELIMQLRDNGHGFDTTTPAEGNGLQSLQRRAQSLQAQFRIDSAQGGTTIFLRAPYKHTAWRRSLQVIVNGIRRLSTKCRALQITANTYLNRGVTRLLQRPTLRPSTIQKRTE